MTLTMLAAALLLAAPQDPAPVPPAEPADEHVRARTCDIDAAGERVAVGMQDGRVLMLSAETGAQLVKVSDPGPAVPWVVRFSPDGERLACVDHGGELRIWELAALEAATPARATPVNESLPGYDFGLRLSWSPTNARLLALDSRGHASLWSASGELVRRWETVAPPGDPQAAWSKDGETLFVADGTAVRALSAEDGEPRARDVAPPTLECGEAIIAFALSPDEARLVTGHNDGRLFTWELASGERVDDYQFVDPVFPDPEDQVAALAFAPAGDRLAFSTREGTHVVVRDLASGERTFTSDFLGAHFFEVKQLAWDPSGAALYYSFECGGGELYRLARDGSVAELGDGFVPRFGGGRAVTIRNWDVVALAPDGSPRWRRIEGRNADSIEVELITDDDE